MFLWFKAVYFLKYFPEVGWMIKMITTAIISAYPFFTILLVTLMAFCEAFYAHSKWNIVRYGGSNEFYNDHTITYAQALRHSYLVMLGEFEHLD